MIQVYLSRRNLNTLLNKLNGVKEGRGSFCSLIKNDTIHPKYPASHSDIVVTAVEDEDYYMDRAPGEVRKEDDPKLTPEERRALILAIEACSSNED